MLFFVSVFRPMGLGKTWTPNEDMALVRSFVHVSHDPSKGADQKGNVFWDRIQSHFSTMVTQTNRTGVALSQRWQGLQSAVSKFTVYYLFPGKIPGTVRLGGE
jgi:hypothetical protein